MRNYLIALLVVVLLPTMTARASMQDVKTVFLILEENQNWASISGNSSAPYINKGLLPQCSYTLQYYNPPGNHPSLPNYLWLEAGTNFNISNDGTPTQNHQSTTNHLVTLLKNAGVSWTSYQEDISGATCPLTVVNNYAPKHNPMVYFDDVTNTNNANSAYCVANVRPFTELVGDLQSNVVTRYNFITPNLCDDMHGNGSFCSAGTANNSLIKAGDTWLSNTVALITSSQAYSNGGAIFITWDEGEGTGVDGPIGMLILSRLARGGGFSNTVHYTHSSTLRTLQEIFNVTPLLRDAANATDLSALFNPFPGITNVSPSCGSAVGGTIITISGSNFVNGAAVTVGGLPATNIGYVNGTTLTAQTPAGSVGSQPVVVTNPDTQTATMNGAFTYVVAPAFGGLSNVAAAIEGATLTWSAATASPPVLYNVFEATASGAENFASPLLTTNGLSAYFPLYPGSNSPITYFFVVRATDGCGNSETNTVEQSLQPLLDPTKSQVGDGIPNGWKQQYGFNPFDTTVATTDSDGDGFSNSQEFLAGTDPTNILSSPFRITNIQVQGNDISVTWQPGTGLTNALQVAAGDGNGGYNTNGFADIFTVTNTSGGLTNYLDGAGATNIPARFYRVRLVP